MIVNNICYNNSKYQQIKINSIKYLIKTNNYNNNIK
jgi:hypothetical protein